MFKAESTERIFSRQVKPMVIFAQVLDRDNNSLALVNMNTCLIINVEENRVIPISPKGTLEEQAKAMAFLKDSKVLLTLNSRGLYVLGREANGTKESHRLHALIISVNHFTMKVKDMEGGVYTIPLNGIDFIETVSSVVSEDAVTP